MEQILKNYSWDLGEYTLRASQAERGKLTMQDAFRAYQLIPALPGLPSGDTNEYIRLAQETHELKYIFFYLHENEQYFNDRINTFLEEPETWAKICARAEEIRREKSHEA